MTREERERAQQVLERATAAEVALDQATMMFDAARTALAAAKDEQQQASQAFREWVQLANVVPMLNGQVPLLTPDGRVILREAVAVGTMVPVPFPTPVSAPVSEPKPRRKESR